MSKKWIPANTTGESRTVYHTDASCKYLKGEKRLVSQSEVEYHEMRECLKCSGEYTRHTDKGRSKYYKLLLEKDDLP